MNPRKHLTSLTFLLAVASLQAQETTGTITGMVTDAKGTPLAGVLVRATSPSLLGVRTATTGDNGTFRMPLMPPGNYELNVSKSGFHARKATMRLSASGVINQGFQLQQAQEVGATVEVVAVSAMADKTETTTKTSFSLDTLSEISGASGTIGYSAVTLAPGVVGGVQYASVRGGSQQGTQYVVNGMSSRDNVTAQARLGDYTLDDLVEDVAVIQSPLNARFGNTSAGVVSLVTKRGSNDWTGTMRAKLFKESWSALRSPYRNRVGGFNYGTEQLGSEDLQRTYEISVTGPIIKDHLSFTYGTRLIPSYYDSQIAQELTLNGMTDLWYNGASYPVEKYQEGQTQFGPNKTTYHQFSLFYQLNQDHSLEWNYSETSQIASDIQYNLVTPDILGTSNYQTSEKRAFTLAYRGVFGSNLLEVRYGKNRSDTQFLSGPNSPINLSAGSGLGSWTDNWDYTLLYTVGGGTADVKPDERATESATINWQSMFELAGSHTLDAGYELQNPIWGTVSRDNSYPTQYTTLGQLSSNPLDYDTSLGYPAYDPATAGLYVVAPYGFFGDSYYDDRLSTYVDVTVGSPSATIKNPTHSLYVNDLWTINKHFSVMAGLRYDKMELKDAKGTRFSSSWLLPRFEVKWDLGGDNRRLLSFTYGQFRGILNARHYRTYAEGRLNSLLRQYWNAGATPSLVTYAQLTNLSNYGYDGGFASSGMYDIDKGFKPEVNHEVTLGFKRSFENGAYWRATAVFRKWKDLFTSVGDPTLVDVPHPLGGSRPSFTTYMRTLKNDPDANREYKGFEFEWNVPFGHAITFGGSYVYGRLTGNNTYGDATSFGAFSGLAETGYFRSQWQAMGLTRDQFEPTGQLALGRNHVLKAWWTYRLATGRTVSSISLQGSYSSGDRQSLTNTFTYPVATVPGTTDSRRPASTALFYNGRGNYSGPDTWNLNLQYNFEVLLKGTVRAFSQLAVTNVLNHFQPGAYYRDAYSSTRAFSTYGVGYWSHSSATQSRRYGTPSSTIGDRSITLDIGLKF